MPHNRPKSGRAATFIIGGWAESQPIRIVAIDAS